MPAKCIGVRVASACLDVSVKNVMTENMVNNADPSQVKPISMENI